MKGIFFVIRIPDSKVQNKAKKKGSLSCKRQHKRFHALGIFLFLSGNRFKYSNKMSISVYIFLNSLSIYSHTALLDVNLYDISLAACITQTVKLT